MKAIVRRCKFAPGEHDSRFVWRKRGPQALSRASESGTEARPVRAVFGGRVNKDDDPPKRTAYGSIATRRPSRKLVCAASTTVIAR